jgi:hypothetical protein
MCRISVQLEELEYGSGEGEYDHTMEAHLAQLFESPITCLGRLTVPLLSISHILAIASIHPLSALLEILSLLDDRPGNEHVGCSSPTGTVSGDQGANRGCSR